MKLRDKNTGEIGQLNIISYDVDIDKSIDIEIILDKSDGETINYTFYRIGDFINYLNDWEDCTQQEPKIDNDIVRHLVYDWASINKIKKVLYETFNDEKGSRFISDDVDSDSCWLEISYSNKHLKGGRYYTITELCGEEE